MNLHRHIAFMEHIKHIECRNQMVANETMSKCRWILKCIENPLKVIQKGNFNDKTLVMTLPLIIFAFARINSILFSAESASVWPIVFACFVHNVCPQLIMNHESDKWNGRKPKIPNIWHHKCLIFVRLSLQIPKGNDAKVYLIALKMFIFIIYMLYMPTIHIFIPNHSI